MGRTSLILFLVAVAHFSSGCATDAASALRQARPMTVGANLTPLIGGQYRPSGNMGIDAVVGGAALGVPAGLFGAGGLWGAIEDGVRGLEEKAVHTFLGASYYPFDSSAFRVGAGLGWEQAKVSFDALLKPGSPAAAPLQRVEYKRQTAFLTIPVGWHWLWDSGFTLALNLGPSFRIMHSTSYVDKGDATTDEADRDSYRDDVENDRKVTYGGLSYIGYSF